MKLSVYNERQTREAPPEKDVALRFVPQRGPERIMVTGVDPLTGLALNCGNLLSIYPDGTFKVCFAAKLGDKEFRKKS